MIFYLLLYLQKQLFLAGSVDEDKKVPALRIKLPASRDEDEVEVPVEFDQSNGQMDEVEEPMDEPIPVEATLEIDDAEEDEKNDARREEFEKKRK